MLCITWYCKIHPFFRFKKRVGESDRVDKFHFRIFNKLRIDIKEDRHVDLKENLLIFVTDLWSQSHLFIGIKLLLLEAKALNFIEIGSSLKWDNVVSTNADYGSKKEDSKKRTKQGKQLHTCLWDLLPCRKLAQSLLVTLGSRTVEV